MMAILIFVLACPLLLATWAVIAIVRVMLRESRRHRQWETKRELVHVKIGNRTLATVIDQPRFNPHWRQGRHTLWGSRLRGRLVAALRLVGR